MKIRDVKKSILSAIAILTFNGMMAQTATTANSEAVKYYEVVTGRADKIVKTLGLTDSVKYYSVKTSIADYYVTLNNIYADRDTQIAVSKRTVTDKAAQEAEKARIEKQNDEKIAVVHAQFVASLSKDLNEKQVAAVKDGLTYNVLNVTYVAYKDMIPSLTEPQKAQIMAWLIEAREHAMDGESADKKHWWFGKYKGRINNYLAAQGYDLQAERAAWEKRLQENKEKRN